MQLIHDQFETVVVAVSSHSDTPIPLHRAHSTGYCTVQQAAVETWGGTIMMRLDLPPASESKLTYVPYLARYISLSLRLIVNQSVNL